MAKNILERMVVHAGQVVLTAGMSNSCAYLIQSGEIICMMPVSGKKIPISRHGPGTIVGENFLFSEEPLSVSYEAAMDSNVVMISRHDFEKATTKLDPLARSLLKAMAAQIRVFKETEIATALKDADIDEEAFQIVQHLIRNLSHDRRMDYEDAMLPHFNELVRVLRTVQERHRHEDQRRHLEDVQSRILGKEGDGAAAPESDVDSFEESVNRKPSE